MSDLTKILNQIREGDAQAADRLIPVVYDELRKLAAQKLSREKPGQTLQATALVHEAFLRLVGDQTFENHQHFMGAAAEAMRRILVERARHKQSLKAGGGYHRIELSDVEPVVLPLDFDILKLNAALEKLENQDPRRAAVVKLRFFAGLTIEQTAETLGIATSTVDSDWAYTRCWLRLEIREC